MTSSRFMPTYTALELTNFLSYKSARIEFDDLVALIGPNASGKSNLVAALKLLRDIPTYGLPLAIARRGGYDQLRHRSQGRPNDPAIRLEFRYGPGETGFYELALASLKGKRYRVKRERAFLPIIDNHPDSFVSDGATVHSVEWDSETDGPPRSEERRVPVAPGQSALSTGGFPAHLIQLALSGLQTVEIHPARVGELQEPSSTAEFDPVGANTASVFDALDTAARAKIVEQLAAIVPGIVRIEPRVYADKRTLLFVQRTAHGNREFLAKQMSDGTLRAFGILLALAQPETPGLIVIEEPEVAIHLGALQSLIEILQAESRTMQVVLTTHSADIVDELPVESLRVVWSDTEQSRVANVSEHTRRILRDGLITPGALLRADALDPES
ncbi:AAA family ATPase [Microbacterium sp. 16-032]|uniref:AAA family ATPase n=1 Tax=Microbacterium sp. 16-032 TaxID=3239808 RepID=UPI0034E245CD